MKTFKTILAVFILLLPMCRLFAGDLSPAGERFRSAVVSCLKSEGYPCSIDDDGDIVFKKEGKSCFVSVYDFNDGVYCKVFHLIKAGDLDEAETRKALHIADEVEGSLKFVRIFRTSSGKLFFIEVGHWFTDISQFRSLFPVMMDVVMTARRQFLDGF